MDQQASDETARTTTLHPRPDLNETYVGPKTDLELTIVDIWKRLLGIENVGIHDNFFDLGGHSLLAVQAISRIVKPAVSIYLCAVSSKPRPWRSWQKLSRH